MERLVFASLLSLVLLALACKKDCSTPPDPNPGYGDTLTIGVTQCVTLPDGFEICLESVPEESRCPTHVLCVWAGAAEAALRFSHFGLTVRDTLFDHAGWDGVNFPDSTFVLHRPVKLVRLIPYPGPGFSATPTSGYSAVVVVSQ